MYDEYNEPTERQIEDWNAHNDHAESNYPEPEEEPRKLISKNLPKFIKREKTYSYNYYYAFKGRIRITSDRHKKSYVIDIGRHEPKGFKFNLTLGNSNEYLTFSWQLFYQKHEEPPF